MIRRFDFAFTIAVFSIANLCFEFRHLVFQRTRTRTTSNTIPYGTEASAAG